MQRTHDDLFLRLDDVLLGFLPVYIVAFFLFRLLYKLDRRFIDIPMHLHYLLPIFEESLNKIF